MFWGAWRCCWHLHGNNSQWQVLPASSLASRNSLGDAEQNPLSCPWVHNKFTFPFSHPNLREQLLPGPPHPTGCTGLFNNDGNLISGHCTSNTSHPCKNQWELAGGSVSLPSFQQRLGWTPSPEAAFRTFPGPKSPSLGLWLCGGQCRSVPCQAIPW